MKYFIFLGLSGLFCLQLSLAQSPKIDSASAVNKDQIISMGSGELIQVFTGAVFLNPSPQKFFLLNGRVRFSCKGACGFKIESAVFKLKDLQGEGEVRLSNTANSVYFETRQGQFFAEILGRKETRQLTSFSAHLFQGEKDWASDLLLKDKKAIRGEWLIPKEKVERESFGLQQQLKQEEELRKKLALLEKKKKQPDRPGPESMICKTPEGALNECNWQCENSTTGIKQSCTRLKSRNSVCVRYRCNAAGKWADRTVIDNLESCLSLGQFSVQKCNY